MKTARQQSPSSARYLQRWLPGALIALAISCWPVLAQPAAGAAPDTVYSVVPLWAGQTGGAYINTKGQVAFNTQTDVVRARFYDGHTVRDLGSLGGPNAWVSGLNEQGQVSGSATVDPGGQTYHAFRWSQAMGMVDFTPSQRAQSSAAGINNRGQVVGFAVAGAYTGSGIEWNPPVPPVTLPLNPTAINDAGTVVGTWGDGPTEVHALVWTSTQGARDLGATPGEDTAANYINRAGHIVGTSGLRAFLWTPRAGLVDLGSGSAPGSTAVKVSDGDVVVGYNRYGADCPAVHYCHGFIWTPQAGFREIISASGPGSLTSARDVNRHGEVVGGVDDHAYLWTGGQGFIDLNTRLVGAPVGLKLLDGLAISDNGAIVATANTGLVLLVPHCACTH